MEDKNFDEKMKDIEREIDSAIDQLFVDKISEANHDLEDYELQPEKTLEEAITGVEKDAKSSSVTEEVPEKKGKEAVFQELDTLKSRVEKFLEWGVTDKALDNVANTIRKIGQNFQENKFIESVTNMVSDVLNFLKENPESHLKEMVDFLTYAFGSIPKLVESGKEGIDPDETFNAINVQFSSISSMMTFDIPKIELEESFAIPEKETAEEVSKKEAGEETESTAAEDETPRRQFMEEERDLQKAEKKAEEESELDMAFVELEEPITEEEPVEEPLQGKVVLKEGLKAGFEEKEEETIASEAKPEGKEPEKTKEIVEEEVEELVVPAVEAEKPLFRYKTFKDIADELSLALKKVENSFFQTNNILDLTGRLSTEIESLVSMTGKMTSYGMPTDSDVKQLQRTVAEINNDFKVLSGFFEQNESLKAEEIVPVIVGKKMVGLLSSTVKNIYAISSAQEADIRQKGAIKIKGEEIPFVDLLEIFGETSESPNKRMVIMEGPDGKKAVLVNRVMKRRFALVSGIGEQDVQKNARFYFAEVIPVYEF